LPEAALLSLLGHLDVRSNEDVVRRYDHEVQGGTALKPFTGVHDHGPGDATVILPLETMPGQATARAGVAAPAGRGVALSNGIRPGYGEYDPYAMAWAVIDEAVRNNVAVGADPDQIAVLDNFCWGNPNLPDRLGALVRCAQGCYDAAVAYQVPFISGKDSLNNEYTGADGQKHAIPGTLLISAIGIVPDVAGTVSMDLKQPGNFLYVVGETRAELGGSHYAQVGGVATEGSRTPPQPLAEPLERYRALHRAIRAGLVRSCHDCSEGGLAVALAEMCIAGGIGAEAKTIGIPRDWHAAHASDEAMLFSESSGRFIVEVRPQDAARFEATMGQVACGCIGVSGGDTVRIHGAAAEPLIALPVALLEQAWRGHLPAMVMPVPRPATKKGGKPPAPHVKPGVRVLILHANGTNRDGDAALACRLAGGEPEIVHVNQLLEGQRRLGDYHMLIIPGGFSYGDDLGAGALWALTLRHGLKASMARFIESGRPVLGICNGFQVLVKAGFLAGPGNDRRQATLTFNQSGRFECRWVYLQPDALSPSIFTRGLDGPIYCPVAHGEGRFAVASASAVSLLQQHRLIPLTYVDGGAGPAGYPANPNGSVMGVAGLCNPEGNVLGLMPHPENHVFPWQHPRRHRGEAGHSGLPLFENGIRYANS
jgi:phosphoribosylformylglycinamidine synthase